MIGARVRNVDWQLRTTGAGRYTADVELPGTLVAKVLRSPHPHARVVSIDCSRALRAPGVVAVLTAEDFGDVTYIHHGGPLSDRPPLARGVVRFIGQEVAAVAAETAAQATAALARISVRYERLPAATTVAEALAPGAAPLHERMFGPNVSSRVERHYGDPAAASRAATTVRGRYRFARQAHACMETSSTLASWEDGRLDLWTSTQAPYFIRKEVAHALGLEMDRVRTHEVAVGGGFGAKSKIAEHEVLAAALSRKAGRPVRLVLDRAEEFAVTKSRHSFTVELETGADADGRLTHRVADVVVDNGAYNHSGPSVTGYGSLYLGSMYRTDGVEVEAKLVDTNTSPGGQFRGYGGPQAAFAVESGMDELADALGVDPIDLRVRNANQTGDVTHAGWRIASSRLVECLQIAREAIRWDEKRALRGSGRGVGVAAAIHVSGARVYEDAERSDAAVDVRPDGRIRVRFGGADAGTGQKTILAQIAAAELGLDVDRVDVLSMASHETPLDLGAWSSRGTYMSGHAVSLAAQSAARRLRGLAALKFGVPPDTVVIDGGRASTDGQDVEIGNLLALADDLVDGELRVEESFIADIEAVNPLTGIADL